MMPSRHSTEAISAYRDALLRDASPETLQELATGIDPDLVEWLDLFRAAQREPVHLDPVFAARLDRAIAEAPGPGQTLEEAEPGKRWRVARSHAVSVSRPPAPLISPPQTRSRLRFAPREVLSALATVAIVTVLMIVGLYTFGPLRPQAPVQMILAPDGPVHLEPIWDVTGDALPILSAYGVGIDPDGNVWVSDAEDRFHIISSDATSHEVWGQRGSGPGQFEFRGNDAAVIREYGDVAFAADGTIYVADTGNSRIQVFSPDRAFLTQWGSKGTEDGKLLAPNAITVAPDGTIYVSDEGRDDIQQFDRNGRFLRVIGRYGLDDGQFSTPAGVAVAASGDIYVADYGNNRIQRFAADGSHIGTWGKNGLDAGEFNKPNDVAVDGEGRVYVVEDFNHRIQVFTSEGQFLTTIGRFGVGLGELNDPLGIAVTPDGRVYVSDHDGVQAFRLVPGAAPATSSFDEVRTETLLDTTTDALPEGHAIIAVERFRMQAGSTPLTISAMEGVVFLVPELGEITVSQGAVEAPLVAGVPYAPRNADVTLQAVGSGDAAAVAVIVTSALVDADAFVTDPVVHGMDRLIETSADGLPGGPARLILERITLSPGSDLPAQEARQWVWTEVSSGALGLALDGARLPFRWDPGEERTFRAGQYLPAIQPGTRMTLRNAGDEALVLYRLTLIPESAEGAATALAS
jgi:DNA-binding beta-propeller fold protein YncE